MTNPQDTIARLRDDKRLKHYPDYLDDPEGLERMRQDVLTYNGHDMASVNFNSLGRLIDTIERLRAALSVPNHSSVGREAVARNALEQIAQPLDCGCVPCRGQCRSQTALECELEARQDIAREALALLPSVPAGVQRCRLCDQRWDRRDSQFSTPPPFGCAAPGIDRHEWVSSVPAGVSEEELSHLRQTVEYLTGVPPKPGVINDFRAPEVDQAILRCRERGDDDTANVLAQMRLVYRRQSNQLQDALAALASPSPDTPEIEGRGQ